MAALLPGYLSAEADTFLASAVDVISSLTDSNCFVLSRLLDQFLTVIHHLDFWTVNQHLYCASPACVLYPSSVLGYTLPILPTLQRDEGSSITTNMLSDW